MHTATNGKVYDFNEYKNFYVFGYKIKNNEISLDQPKKEQETILNMIYELKKIDPNRVGPKYKENNRKSIEEVLNNEKSLYEARNDIINVFEEKKQKEEKEPNFDGIKYIDPFNQVLENVKNAIGLEGIVDEKRLV